MADINTGFIRRMDELGRLYVPKELRRQVGFREGDYFEYILHDDGIFIRKHPHVSINKLDLISAAAAMSSAFPSVRFFPLDEHGEVIVPGIDIAPKARAAAKDAVARCDIVATADEGGGVIMVVPIIVDSKVCCMLMAVAPTVFVDGEVSDIPDRDAILTLMRNMANCLTERIAR